MKNKSKQPIGMRLKKNSKSNKLKEATFAFCKPLPQSVRSKPIKVFSQFDKRNARKQNIYIQIELCAEHTNKKRAAAK